MARPIRILLASLAIASVAATGASGDMIIRLKDGRVVTVPVGPGDIQSITFGGPDPAVQPVPPTAAPTPPESANLTQAQRAAKQLSGTASGPAATPGVAANPTLLRVGPDQPIKTPSAAAAVARDGDTIEIQAGLYRGDVAVWLQNDLVIRGMGGMAHMDAAGNAAEGKGTWVIKGNRAVIENIEFSGSRVPDANGAGIRLEGSGLTIRHSSFHDNENGILTGGRRGDGDVVIEYSVFARNGHGDGSSHNMYIGTERSFTLRYSYSHHAKVGHTVKSRARSNFILYNRIMDEADGTSSYGVDLPDGGSAVLIGNLLQQGPLNENSGIVSYGAERLVEDGELYLVNNTIVNDHGSGSFLMRKGNGKTVLVNNIFAGPGTISAAGAFLKGNLLVQPGGEAALARFARGLDFAGNFVAADAGFVDRKNFDYRLGKGSPAIGKGVDPGASGGRSLRPEFQYVHPANARPRKAGAVLDIGALEFEGAR